MISRFTQIKGIGKFINCANIGGKQFEINTIIFGHNTGGKSTLTDILWSFKTGDTSFIEGRKSFGFFGNQIVEIVDESNNVIKYPSAIWNNGYENIEIFDTQFINENVFEGNEIKYGNQKKLHSILIGQEGKRLSDEINSSQEKFAEITKEKTDRTKYFNQAFSTKISVTDFQRLPKHSNPDDLIKELKATISVAANQQKIKSVIDLASSLIDNITNQTTKQILSQTVQTNAELVTKHILKTWKNSNQSKEFLQIGLTLTKEEKENCVFCGQSLNNEAIDLLQAYSQLFSEAYKKFHNDIIATVSKFDKFNPNQILESLKDKFETVGINLDLSNIDNKNISNLKTVANDEFQRKKDDLSYDVNFEAFDNLIEIFSSVKATVLTISDKYIFKTEANIQNLESKIFEIETSKVRHTDKWNEFFNEGNRLETEQDQIKLKREKLRIELNNYSNSLYETHFDTINKILSVLGADFQICDFKPLKNLVGQSERVFELEFYKAHKIFISETTTNRPRFKNTLSESDKRLLAFSFFYSLLLHDKNLDKKIVVFDDPFSSFDTNRRTKTVELLSNPYLITIEGERIDKKFAQLIILTHESEFYKWIFKKLDNPKALKIVDDGYENGVKKSSLADCNVYDEFIEDKNKKDLKIIKQVVSQNKPVLNYEELTVKCRKILESIFTRKYFFDLTDEINSKLSIRSFVEKLKELTINDFDNNSKYKEFIMLCDNLNIELHDNSFANDGQNSIGVLNDFLKLIKRI